MNAPARKPVDLTRCATKVWGTLAGTARWQGASRCKRPVAVKSLRLDGSTVACFCTQHAPVATTANGLIIVPV